MTADTPIWICAYGNNQWDLLDITEDPRQSGFTKALSVAKGKTITILDKDGMVFTRVWCLFELFLKLIDPQQKKFEEDSEMQVWAVYTAKNHTYEMNDEKEEREAVGIISGGAPCDDGDSDYTTAREKSFPYSVLSKALTIKIEDADATVEADRVHILNSIIGKSSNDLDCVPPEEHDAYTALNWALKSIFAASQASLQGAAKEENEDWMAMLGALSKGTKKEDMTFDFGSEGGFSGLTATRAVQLISHLPLTIKLLWIENAEFGGEFIESLIEQVKIFKNLVEFHLIDTFVGGERGGQEVGVRLAEVLAINTTITEFSLDRTDLIGSDNVAQWGDALVENNTLINFWVKGVEAEIKDELKARTKDRTLKLRII